MNDLESRLRRVEDHIAIYQIICGYGCALDGCNALAVGGFYAEDGVYTIGDLGRFEGRDAIAALTQNPIHLGLVDGGAGHLSTAPYIVIDGDRAVATCHMMLVRHAENNFVVGRLSASRIELERKADGTWQIVLRTNLMLDGNPASPALLARLMERPAAAGVKQEG